MAEDVQHSETLHTDQMCCVPAGSQAPGGLREDSLQRLYRPAGHQVSAQGGAVLQCEGPAGVLVVQGQVDITAGHQPAVRTEGSSLATQPTQHLTD